MNIQHITLDKENTGFPEKINCITDSNEIDCKQGSFKDNETGLTDKRIIDRIILMKTR